jgi:transcriptional regulator with XRE-family HTH domain
MENVITILQWFDEPIQSVNAEASTAEWARNAKEEKSKRIESLCEALECHKATIMNYANGKVMPKRIEREAIAKIVGAPVLFTKDGEIKVSMP